MPGREERGEAKRLQILAGARRVFLREGFAATDTDTLAREAGVSKRTLYAYYPGKEALFADVVRSLTVEHPETRLLDFVRGVSPRTADELRSALVTLAGKVLATIMEPDYLALMRTIIADLHRFPQLGDIFRATVPERGMAECGALLQRARANGVAVAGSPDAATRLFMGPLLTFAVIDGLFRPGTTPEPPDAGRIEEIVDLFMRAIGGEDATERGAG